jgi:hypothetical protein
MDAIVKEAIEAVSSINDKILDQTEEDSDMTCFFLEAITTGDRIIVKFCGIPIWDNDNDERDSVWENGSNEIYEPLEPFMIREINRILTLLKKIAL